MKEALLHYAWRLRRFEHRALQTTEGEVLEIVHPGQHNQHAGPDFLHAKIRIGATLWVGHVEMHLKASDWYRHRHQEDAAYRNVVLHVVMEEDEVVRISGSRLPCLELKSRLTMRLVTNYGRLMHSEHWIACAAQFEAVPETTKLLWLDRLLVERLEQKTIQLEQRLEVLKNDWETLFYHLLGRYFGFNVNNDAFEALVRSLPLALQYKHKQQRLAFEALFFGQAGLLNEDFQDSYPQKLQREYQFLAKKYQLHPIPKVSWRYLRLRPANFPTLRIAQFAALLFQTTHLFNKVLSARTSKELYNLFDVSVSPYWLTHYQFDKPSRRRKKTLGQKSIELLLVNAIIPTLFLYGKLRGPAHFQERALQLLEALPAENNLIIRHWQALGLSPKSAYHSQGLLQWKQGYCASKRCLECAVGCAILK
ncbi:MAG: DUF2851 family protein [Bacteroidota bacterium]